MTKCKNELTIDGNVYVLKSEKQEEKDGLSYVLIRTTSAGVHCGYLKSRAGKEVELIESIRIWYWDGAASLSQLATEGVSKPENCKFGVPISVTLTEAIEVIKVSEKAAKIIKSVPPWRK